MRASPVRRVVGLAGAHRHVVVAGILAGAAVAQLLVRPAPAGPSLEVRSVSASTSGFEGHGVSVRVANPRGTPVAARVWWLLAPPGAGSEWDRRAYTSAVRPLVVAPGTSVDLHWDEPALVPQGDYVLSAWAHVPGPGGFEHASGKVADSRIGVGPGPLLRAGPPRFDVRIADVAPTVGAPDDPSSVDAVVSLLNTAESPRRAHVRLALVPVVGADDPSWWRAAPAWTTDDVTVEVGAGGRSVVPVRGQAAVPPGRYLVRATLIDPAPDLDGPIDEVGLVGSFRVIGLAS